MSDRDNNGGGGSAGSAPRSKFEWGPEDVTILHPGDEGYDDPDDEGDEESGSTLPIDGTEP